MDKRPESEQSESDEDLKIIPQQPDIRCYITDPQQFLAFSLQDKKIKVMDECNPIFNHVYLKDISLHKKGPLQDKIYSRVGKYYRNIRRGNTLCQIYHPDQNQNKEQTYDLFFCRRGMKKFYDLQPDYLKVGAALSTHHRLMRNRIFGDLQEDLDVPGGVYHLYCLFKQNGEHCQISYLKELSSWLFASKNVAILARDPEDLNRHYYKERFYWAKLIGEQFFKILERMGAGQAESFKKDIEGYTLLGEHCGNEQHQHITRYDQVQIIFYGFVSNIGGDHCQPVQQCRAFLQKYGLKMSACKERLGLGDKNKIYSSMWEMLREVGEGRMAQEGEGSVMYIVSEREGKQRTVGMCKLKTCEYLIYRRLREMLKLNVARKGSTANNFQKYKFQIQQLVQHYFKPPKPLEFYYQLGERAFKQCGSNSEISETYLRYKFVDFIAQFEQNHGKVATGQPSKQLVKRIILVCLPRLGNALQKYCRGRGFQVEYMFRAGKPISKTTVHILYMIPRFAQPLEPHCSVFVPVYGDNEINQCIKQLNQCKDLTRSHLITFIKCQDKAKNVKMLYEKIQGFRKNCKDTNMPIIDIGSSQQELIGVVQKFTQQHVQQKVVIPKLLQARSLVKHFILPLLIPGSGKSTLGKELLNNKQSKFQWKIIDADSMRRGLMEQLNEVDLDDEKVNNIFFQTKDLALNQFIQQLIKQAETPPKTRNQCVFIDRIYSSSNIEQTIQILKKTQKAYIKVHILTQNYFTTKLNQKTYPYSLNYLLSCLKRCLQRPDHQTMPNSPYLVSKIVIKFYQKMANFSQKAILKRYEGGINFISIPLIEDSEESSCINQQLRKKVEECLLLVEPGYEAKDSDSFIELVQSLYKFGQFKDSKNLQRYRHLATILEEAIVKAE